MFWQLQVFLEDWHCGLLAVWMDGFIVLASADAFQDQKHRMIWSLSKFLENAMARRW